MAKAIVPQQPVIASTSPIARAVSQTPEPPAFPAAFLESLVENGNEMLHCWLRDARAPQPVIDLANAVGLLDAYAQQIANSPSGQVPHHVNESIHVFASALVCAMAAMRDLDGLFLSGYSHTAPQRRSAPRRVKRPA